MKFFSLIITCLITFCAFGSVERTNVLIEKTNDSMSSLYDLYSQGQLSKKSLCYAYTSDYYRLKANATGNSQYSESDIERLSEVMSNLKFMSEELGCDSTLVD
jgi:hypothetical protein